MDGINTSIGNIGDGHLLPSVSRRDSERSIFGSRRPTNESIRRRRLRDATRNVMYPSSLDFERVVNEYSIQAMRDRLLEIDTSAPTSDPPSSHGLTQTTTAKEVTYHTFYPEIREALPPPPPPIRGETSWARGLSSMQTFWKLHDDRNPMGYSGRAATRWFLTVVVGALTGVIAISIVTVTSAIESWRSNLMDSLWRNNRKSLLIFVLFAATNLVLALLSSILCVYFAPQAAGSGIPEVKAYLNGVRVQRFANLPLFLVKILGTILSVSSGLAIGPEGPLVHIGAIIGAGCTKAYKLLLTVLPKSVIRNPFTWSVIILDFSHFAHDDEVRDLVSIGAAAGFAAAFGAPIGGLLFSLEEASSSFDQHMFLKTMVATAVATFTLAVHNGNLSDYSVISLGHYRTPDLNIFLNRVEEIPLYILVAVSGGILGGVFCQCWRSLQRLRHHVFVEPTARRRWNIFQVACVSLLTSGLMYYVPLMNWSCRPVDVNDDLVSTKSVFDPWKFHPHQFDCPTGYINELATVFFGSREDAIAYILSDPQQFKPQTLWCVGILFFVLMTLTLGVSIPSGIFMPTFLIGTSLGGAAGVLFREWLHQEIAPSTFALLGAAALLAGIQRSTVSLCVILVEGTGQVKVLIPVIITVVISRYVASWICEKGLYELAMELNHYPYLEHVENRKLDVFKVRDIMSTPPRTVGPRERADTLVKLLTESNHHGFPVVDPISRKCLGLVRRDQLVALLECGVFEETCSTDDDESSSTNTSATANEWTPRPGVSKTPLMSLAYHITDDRYEAIDNKHLVDEFDSNSWLVSIRKSHEHLNELDIRPVATGDDSMPPLTAKALKSSKIATVGINDTGDVIIKWLNPDHRRKWVHVAAVTNLGTCCVNDFCPVSKALHIFTAMGLRHLIVLGGDTGGQVVGVLTRINFLNEYIEERTRCNLWS